MKLQNKTILITGATGGIGRETAIALAKEGAHLILPARNIEKGKLFKAEIKQITGNDNIDILFCDFQELDTVKKLADDIKKKYSKIDILINNAGIWMTKLQKTKNNIEATWQVNHLAPFLLTHLLLDLIPTHQGSRIINLSSAAHWMGKIDFDDIEGLKKYNWLKSYSQSKLANMLFTRKLSILLKDKNITVNCVHPGVVKTNLLDHMPKWFLKILNLFLITPAKGARTSIYLATSDDVKNITGEYFANCKITFSSKEGKNMQTADKLWETTFKYLEKN